MEPCHSSALLPKSQGQTSETRARSLPTFLSGFASGGNIPRAASVCKWLIAMELETPRPPLACVRRYALLFGTKANKHSREARTMRIRPERDTLLERLVALLGSAVIFLLLVVLPAYLGQADLTFLHLAPRFVLIYFTYLFGVSLVGRLYKGPSKDAAEADEADRQLRADFKKLMRNWFGHVPPPPKRKDHD
jgi:hypothetical protein